MLWLTPSDLYALLRQKCENRIYEVKECEIGEEPDIFISDACSTTDAHGLEEDPVGTVPVVLTESQFQPDYGVAQEPGLSLLED